VLPTPAWMVIVAGGFALAVTGVAQHVGAQATDAAATTVPRPPAAAAPSPLTTSSPSATPSVTARPPAPPKRRTTTTVTAPSTAAAGARPAVTVHVREAAGGVKGVQVVLYARDDADAAWRVIGRTISGAGGLAVFSVPVGSGVELRAQTAPDRRHSASHSSTAAVAVVPQLTVRTSPSIGLVGLPSVAFVTVAPHAAGQQVRLQALQDGSWVTVENGTVGADGRTTLKFTSDSAGTVRLRVVADPLGHVAGATSQTVAVKFR
jgi:hypothetical protein